MPPATAQPQSRLLLMHLTMIRRMFVKQGEYFFAYHNELRDGDSGQSPLSLLLPFPIFRARVALCVYLVFE